MDDWLKHRGTEWGGSGKLGSWKDDGRITIWLHTKRLPVAVWQHNLPKLVTFESKKSGEMEKHYWGEGYNCPEPEDVLRRQYKINEDGSRKEEITGACGVCKMLEFLAMSVESGELNWTDKVLEYRGADDPEEDCVLHVGGMLGYFGRDLDEDEEADLKEHRIKPSLAWKENAMGKLKYVLPVVDHAHPEKGVQIAVQPQSVGDAIKKVIADEMASEKREEDGNPQINPYAIELLYDDREPNFSKQYTARRIKRVEMTPAIEKLIRGESPDLSFYIDPMNGPGLRAILEQHALVQLPWDDLFKKVAKGKPPREDRFEPEELEKTPPSPPARSRGRGRVPDVAREEKKPEPPPKDGIPCDECKHIMAPTDLKCSACGTEYEEDDEEEAPPPPPKKGGRRGQAKGADVPLK
jgi:hypothetical protein